MTPLELKKAELESLRLIKRGREAGDKKAELAGLRALKQVRNVSGLAQERAQQPTEKPVMQRAAEMYANPEAALSVATGAVAEPVAGLAGLGGAALSGLGLAEEGAGARAVEGTREALTYQPRTEFGQAGLDALAPVGEAVQAIERGAGELGVAAAEKAGVDPNSEAAATIYGVSSAVPEAVGALIGARYAPKPKPGRPRALTEPVGADDAARMADEAPMALDDTAQRLEPQSAPLKVKEPIVGKKKAAELRQAINEGSREAAGYRINKEGKVVRDPLGRAAVSEGWDDRVVAGVKQLSQADRQAALKMLDIAENKLKRFRTTDSRPSNVIGESVMKRWQTVSDANKQARQDINVAARKDLAGQQVDVSDAVDSFMDSLDELGVQMGEEGAEFRGSQLEGSNVAPVKRVLNRLKAVDDGFSLHKLKQYIDSQIDWDKKPGTAKPIDEKAQNALKSLRGQINEKLKMQSEAYADANARAAETFESMGAIRDTFGRRFDPSSENINAYAGREIRKVLSEYGVSDDMLSAIDRLEETARKYGGQFDDDPVNLAQFYSHMERRLGSFSPNSFQGKIEKGLARQGVEATTGGKLELAARGIDKARELIKGPQDEAAINAMRKLLRGND